MRAASGSSTETASLNWKGHRMTPSQPPRRAARRITRDSVVTSLALDQLSRFIAPLAGLFTTALAAARSAVSRVFIFAVWRQDA
jgi:hypothetical protein